MRLFEESPNDYDEAAPDYDEVDDGFAPERLRRTLMAEVLREPAKPLQVVRPALQRYPTDPNVLIAASLAALLEERPDQGLAYLKRLNKHYVPTPDVILLEAIALAQKGNWFQAGRALKTVRSSGLLWLRRLMPKGYDVRPWVRSWQGQIEQESKRRTQKPEKTHRRVKERPAREATQKSAAADEQQQPASGSDSDSAMLPLVAASIPISFNLPDWKSFALSEDFVEGDLGWFRLRKRIAELSLLQGFDQLLCLPLLHNLDTYWYQVETVRKVLKQFRGRVLLADEVGLGKTIEAGMVLKEYMLRGMVERVLVLTPASMVGQWLEEMESKFDLAFATSYDSLLRTDPAAFWQQPRVIASIAVARRAENFNILKKQSYDLVIIDEAHHLKNRATSNWKLVDSMQKRFLLLLSATPIQNNLAELYNLLTLLKPGIFKTEKEFRATYMTRGRPRVPANKDRMRDLMREVMVRNTRAHVDVSLPKRTALTLKVDASELEASCYRDLTALVQERHRRSTPQLRLTLRHLQAAAGSSPAAAREGIRRFVTSHDAEPAWLALFSMYASLETGAKEAALIDLLGRNPDEKKMIFVHHRETLARLDRLLQSRGFLFARFEGSMTGQEKDRAVRLFRDSLPLLLCTESGGEGRNMQFCNTLINFDLPWNPMAIEQRIGRIHRIGQARPVFVFNLCVRDTLEEYVLRILDEKINMFEMVVGEIDAVLGEMDEDHDFAEAAFCAWVETTEQGRAAAFEELADRMVRAKRQYEAVKALDDELFGDEFETD